MMPGTEAPDQWSLSLQADLQKLTASVGPQFDGQLMIPYISRCRLPSHMSNIYLLYAYSKQMIRIYPNRRQKPSHHLSKPFTMAIH